MILNIEESEHLIVYINLRITIQYKDEFGSSTINDLNYGPSMSENPTHRSIWHLFKELHLEFFNSLQQLRRD